MNGEIILNKQDVTKYITPLVPMATLLKPEGHLDMKIKCVLFDIYGTLFISGAGDIGVYETQRIKKTKINGLLHDFGINEDPDLILKRLRLAIENKHSELRKKGVDFPEVAIDRLWMNVLGIDDVEVVKRFATLFELITNPVYPMPNIKKMLSACKTLNVSMGIISNAQFYTKYLFQWFLNSSLEELGFHSDLIFYSYIFGHAKPSILMFHKASEKLEEMGICKEDVLYLGNDMLNDISPAKKAGFKTALFAGDARSLRLRQDHPQCQHINADIVITDLIQLLDFV